MTSEGDGGLSPGNRFDRMERSLMRIEEKLDRKVDRADLEPLRKRIELLESGESPLGRVLLEQFNTMQKQIGELQLHGSANAQTASDEVAKIKAVVAGLESNAAATAAVTNASRERDLRFFRSWTAACSALSVVAVLAGTHAIHL